MNLDLVQTGETFVAADERSKKTLKKITNKTRISFDEFEDLEIVCERHNHKLTVDGEAL